MIENSTINLWFYNNNLQNLSLFASAKNKYCSDLKVSGLPPQLCSIIFDEATLILC